MFEITDKNINNLNEISTSIINNQSVGGIVYFQGVVRNHNDGKDVTSLEYEAYDSMGIKIGKNIVADAIKKFGIEDAYCIHRTGHLKLNDTAVWVITTSHHRKEAYDANQYIIDRIKSEVPIWKKEHYVNEEPVWVACHRCMKHGHHHHG
ncbi:MAG: molybdenum cofactor biosynthesis protein MoaE [Bacteriovoracaceae bacterium]|jgi:molybdopterin synthase catalytic subunit|nr:molybdenum cofactor biosynthesis protein MoaE [Bacteriovoracaceae bacterium]